MKKILILILICIFCIACDGILNSEGKTTVFYVLEINGNDIDSEEFKINNSVYPQKLIFENIEKYNYSGKVKFDSIGVQKIENYEEYTGNENWFYVDVEDILNPVETINFNNIEINEDSLFGHYCFAGATIDGVCLEFKAYKK